MSKNQLKAVHGQSIARLIVMIILAMVLLSTGSINHAAPSTEPLRQDTVTTPYQEALQNALNQRKSNGHAVPTVTYDVSGSVSDASGSAMAAPPPSNDVGGQQVIVSATTTIHFDNPQQAGYEQWPELIIEGSLPEGSEGTVIEGNYNDRYYAYMEEQLPGIWDTYEFGQQPRIYTITETFTITYPETNSLSGASAGSSGASPPPPPVTKEQILMGFTYTGPQLDYSIEDKLRECLGDLCATIYDFKAGFDLDWAMGLRLPAEVSLTGPDEMILGNNYNFSSTLNPQNWSAGTYSGYGVAPEGGNEFVLRLDFFAGVKAKVIGIDVCPNCYKELNEDYSESFTTPFGAGSSFPIPNVNVPIYEFDVTALKFSIDLQIDPDIGSSMITADWNAVPNTDCVGSGTVTYTEPGQAATVGPVLACNKGPTDQAQIEVSNFEYHFNEFLITLRAVLDFDLFGYGVWHEEPKIISFDLGPITGALYLPDHIECDWKFDCDEEGPDNTLVVSSTVVDETAPTTSINLAGTVGDNDWFTSDVQVSFDAVDGPVVDGDECGVGVNFTEYSFDETNWMEYTGPFMLTDEGITTVYFRSVDLEGNVEETQSQVIKIDKTPPEITGYTTTDPNVYGWWNTNVTVHFEATDAVSGIAYLTPDVVVSTEGENQFVEGEAIDMAGNSATFTVWNINIDKTPPDVTINDPLPIAYANTESFNIDWVASDSLSGIAEETGDMDGVPVTNGQLVELLLVGAGYHAVTVEAVDKADNATTELVVFLVTTDLNGMIESINYMCEIGWITNGGICNSLLAKLHNAKAALDRGQCHVAVNMLNAFVNEVSAQNGQHISSEGAGVMTTNALYIMSGLPDECEEDEPEPEVLPDDGQGDGDNGQDNGNNGQGNGNNGQNNGNNGQNNGNNGQNNGNNGQNNGNNGQGNGNNGQNNGNNGQNNGNNGQGNGNNGQNNGQGKGPNN